MIKKIVAVVVVIVVALGIAFYLLYSNLGPILKAAIEKYGAEATQAQVKVDSVTLSAWSGRGTISGLVVGNPQGFTTPQALDLASIAITVDTSTLTRNPVEVTDVTISSPRVTYEQGASGGNLQKLQQNVRQYAGGSASARAPGAAQPAPTSQPPASNATPGAAPASAPAAQAERKLIIDKLDVTGGEVTVAATLLKGRTLTTALPPIHLVDIGKKEGGATPAQVAQLVITAIAEQAAKAAAAELQKNLGGAAQQQLEQLQKSPPDLGSKLKGVLGK